MSIDTAAPARLSPREMLARLVAFPTVSSSSNLDLVDFVRGYLADHGVASTLVPSADGAKASLYAAIGPAAPGGVVLSGHTDVVPADQAGWTSEPWTLVARDGRLYGRGATDMKGFVAAVLAAVPDMVAADLRAPVHIALSYDEEVGCKGAPDLVAEMASRAPAPRAVIVGEPSRMRLVTGHKGSLSFYTHVRGHTVHSSRVDTGVSAVMVAARLVTWFDDAMAANRAAADPGSPFEPPYTTLHCGMIEGGTAPNIVAEACSFVTDIRAVPDENPRDYRARYEDHVRREVEPAMHAISAQAGVDIVHRSEVPGLRPEESGAAAALVGALTGDARAGVVSYGTEAGLFQAAGWSTVVCGPGDIAQTHRADEYIEESELAAAARFMHRLIGELAG